MGEKYLFAALLVLLIACQPEVRSIPTSEYQPPIDTTVQQTVDLCKDVNCTAGKVCQQGNCVCPSGKKACEDDCIPKDDCCTGKDCASGMCEDGKCLEPKECRLNEEFKSGECKCAKDKVYCKDQNRCIDSGDCCIHGNCDRFERCVPTNWRTSFCIKIEEKKICKILSDLNRTESYEVQDNEFEVKPTDWWQDESITILVNNESMRLKKDETKLLDNATIFHEGIQITGGFCKEDEED